VATTTHAQTTWNYIISDAGGGNSLVTWNVSGSLATSPGSVWVFGGSILTLAVTAPGIYADGYVASGTNQVMSTPDGSYFQLDGTSVYAPIVMYYTDNATGTGNDAFGLVAAPFFPRDSGVQLFYQPGTQSVLLPIDFADFNTGTYQSQLGGLDTPVTVNLTVAGVPEPSALALSAVGAVLLAPRRKP